MNTIGILEDMVIKAKKRRDYYETNISRYNDYEDGYANGLLEENEVVIDVLEETIEKLKGSKK